MEGALRSSQSLLPSRSSPALPAWLHRKFDADLVLMSQGSALNFNTHKGISHFWFLTQIPCVFLSPLPWNSCVHMNLPFLVSKAHDFGLFFLMHLSMQTTFLHIFLAWIVLFHPISSVCRPGTSISSLSLSHLRLYPLPHYHKHNIFMWPVQKGSLKISFPWLQTWI